VQQARLAESWGADGIMLLPPMRYKADDRETVVFFKSVAKQTALPIMIYNNPVDYKINVTLEMFKELSECKNINAIKESTREVNECYKTEKQIWQQVCYSLWRRSIDCGGIGIGGRWTRCRLGGCFSKRDSCIVQFGESRENGRGNKNIQVVHAIA